MATTVDSRRETVSLIGSDKVDGTAVYGASVVLSTRAPTRRPARFHNPGGFATAARAEISG
ncbi:MAG TPA: hypothetical protein VN938_03585 [Xanthobacteraceae bacterium]|jgi:hypothetical protein|nr:hypothetical protein [Xanthobacteraceae bacterium]